jgi:hypothetical protein
VDRRAWTSYVGLYTDPWGWQARVVVRQGQLYLYEHSYPPEDAPEDSLSLLAPVSQHTFRLSDGEPLVFEMDESATADTATVRRIRKRYEYLYPVLSP